jgi:S-adenosylmethionine hydrolase
VAHALTQAAYFLPQVSATFHGRDIFGPVAAHLARGIEPARFGPPLTSVVQLPYPPPQRQGQTITGEVIYLDRFGNIITNIPSALLTDLVPGQAVVCSVATHTRTIPFVQTYGTGPQDQLVGLINSNGEFEIALPGGGAAARLDVRVGARVVLKSGERSADA